MADRIVLQLRPSFQLRLLAQSLISIIGLRLCMPHTRLSMSPALGLRASSAKSCIADGRVFLHFRNRRFRDFGFPCFVNFELYFVSDSEAQQGHTEAFNCDVYLSIKLDTMPINNITMTSKNCGCCHPRRYTPLSQCPPKSLRQHSPPLR